VAVHPKDQARRLAQQPAMGRTALPKSASEVPLVGLLGMMLIVAAAVSYMTRVER